MKRPTIEMLSPISMIFDALMDTAVGSSHEFAPDAPTMSDSHPITKQIDGARYTMNTHVHTRPCNHTHRISLQC